MLKRKNPFVKAILNDRKEMESKYKSDFNNTKKALEEMQIAMKKLSAKKTKLVLVGFIHKKPHST